MNNLQGPIPPELGQLQALKTLSLGSNQLSALPRLEAEGFAAGNVTVFTSDNPWKEPPAEIFLTPGTLFVLVVDMFTYAEGH
ncbi:unnamed protein product [Ectocarpus sp. 12 AP-2014]